VGKEAGSNGGELLVGNIVILLYGTIQHFLGVFPFNDRIKCKQDQ